MPRNKSEKDLRRQAVYDDWKHNPPTWAEVLSWVPKILREKTDGEKHKRSEA